MRSNEETERAIRLYADMVYRISILYLKNEAEAQDVFQDVFLKYALSSCAFESNENEKAWLIRVTINSCKDQLKSFFRKKKLPLEDAFDWGYNDKAKTSDTLEAVLALPKKYKDVIYLYYYEGYSAEEIGELVSKNKNTVYTLLARGRKILEKKLGGEIDG